jgi:hypothetical protein
MVFRSSHYCRHRFVFYYSSTSSGRSYANLLLTPLERVETFMSDFAMDVPTNSIKLSCGEVGTVDYNFDCPRARLCSLLYDDLIMSTTAREL